MSTASEQFAAYERGEIDFEELLAWAQSFDWATAYVSQWDEPDGMDLERAVPWPTPDSAEEIEAAFINGMLTEAEADILFDAIADST